MNGYGELRRMTDRNPAIVVFYPYLAAAFVTIRQLTPGWVMGGRRAGGLRRGRPWLWSGRAGLGGCGGFCRWC